MEGFVPYGQDAGRLAHREKYSEYERQVRLAIREGRVLRDEEMAKAPMLGR